MITTHLEALRAEDKQVHRMMQELVRQRDDLRRDQRLLKTIKGIGVKSALVLLASVPELGRIDNKAAAALIGVAPFVRKSGTMNAPARIHGGRAPVRSILYMAAVTASKHNPLLSPFYDRLITRANLPKLPSSPCSDASSSSPTPCSGQASPGKAPAPLDMQHGKIAGSLAVGPAAGRPAGSSLGMTGSLFHKLFSFFRKYRLTAIWARHIVIRSRPERGALRNVTKRGARCGGRGGAVRRTALRRTEKTCGPDTPTLVSSLR